jgi:DNA recombination protein RmuC
VGWEAVAVALLAGALVGVLAARLGPPGRGGGWLAAGQLERRLAGISDSLDRRLVDLDRRLYLGLDGVQDAQLRAADSAAEVRERVAVVAGVAEQVLEQARGLARLEDLLRPPQARGALGELLLEQLLAQGLPGSAYRTQHAFRSGARVDAVLLIGDAMVAVDSKFPLEAFARMSTTGEGEPARLLHRRAFVRDARRHVDAIADKYICPDEGTYDFALCYLPSEAVFYEFLREDPPGDSCWRYAMERRVFPTSPTTLYAYLIAIGVGLRGLRVEENARRVLDALAALRGELDGFRRDFELVGRHLGRARGRWEDAAHRLDRFDGRVAEAAGRATDLDRAGGDADALPEPEGFGEPQGGAPLDKEGFGDPQGGAPINRGDDGLTGTG